MSASRVRPLSSFHARNGTPLHGVHHDAPRDRGVLQKAVDLSRTPRSRRGRRPRRAPPSPESAAARTPALRTRGARGRPCPARPRRGARSGHSLRTAGAGPVRSSCRGHGRHLADIVMGGRARGQAAGVSSARGAGVPGLRQTPRALRRPPRPGPGARSRWPARAPRRSSRSDGGPSRRRRSRGRGLLGCDGGTDRRERRDCRSGRAAGRRSGRCCRASRRRSRSGRGSRSIFRPSSGRRSTVGSAWRRIRRRSRFSTRPRPGRPRRCRRALFLDDRRQHDGLPGRETQGLGLLPQVGRETAMELAGHRSTTWRAVVERVTT